MQQKKLLLGLFTLLLLGLMNLTPTATLKALSGGEAEQEVVVCPGKGERCAKVAGIFWKKKTKGGPGIIIKN